MSARLRIFVNILELTFYVHDMQRRWGTMTWFGAH